MSALINSGYLRRSTPSINSSITGVVTRLIASLNTSGCIGAPSLRSNATDSVTPGLRITRFSNSCPPNTAVGSAPASSNNRYISVSDGFTRNSGGPKYVSLFGFACPSPSLLSVSKSRTKSRSPYTIASPRRVIFRIAEFL